MDGLGLLSLSGINRIDPDRSYPFKRFSQFSTTLSSLKMSSSVIAFDEINNSSTSSVSLRILMIHGLLGSGNDFADFSHSLASSFSSCGLLFTLSLSLSLCLSVCLIKLSMHFSNTNLLFFFRMGRYTKTCIIEVSTESVSLVFHLLVIVIFMLYGPVHFSL